MKKVLLSIFLFTVSISLQAQPEGREPLYDTEAEPVAVLSAAVHEAASSGRHIMLKIGGKWCYRFNDYVKADAGLDSLLHANYVVMHVNHSKENRNLPFLASLGYPQRFGFPVFVVLSADGTRLHTQSSWYLEGGEASWYDPKKVKAFLEDWSAAAFDPANYKDK